MDNAFVRDWKQHEMRWLTFPVCQIDILRDKWTGRTVSVNKYKLLKNLHLKFKYVQVNLYHYNFLFKNTSVAK